MRRNGLQRAAEFEGSGALVSDSEKYPLARRGASGEVKESCRTPKLRTRIGRSVTHPSVPEKKTMKRQSEQRLCHPLPSRAGYDRAVSRTGSAPAPARPAPPLVTTVKTTRAS